MTTAFMFCICLKIKPLAKDLQLGNTWGADLICLILKAGCSSGSTAMC